MNRGICSTRDRAVEQSDITWLKNSFGVGSRELPFFHECAGHGFGWYNALNIPPGTYLAAAGTGSFYFGILDGHGTGDTFYTFWYEQTGGGCTPSCSGKTCGASNGCGGTCCSGSGCTPVSCPTCQQPNACGSACQYSPTGTSCPGRTCNGSGTCQGGGQRSPAVGPRRCSHSGRCSSCSRLWVRVQAPRPFGGKHAGAKPAASAGSTSP